MKKIIIIISFLITFNLYSQVYNRESFKLNGDVRTIYVTLQEITQDNSEYIESFPITDNFTYKTDLNLYYIEFYNDGLLKRSKLYYPRNFYGQFELLSPQLDLESSDFGEKVNYLTKKYSYKYNIQDDNKISVEQTSDNGEVINYTLNSNGELLKDEYYIYTYESTDNIDFIKKKRKDSDYNYRRIEKETLDNRVVTKEFLNNRFLMSKEIEIKTADIKESIYVSQSKIMLVKDLYNNSKIEKRSFVTLRWHNIFKDWPEIDFNDEYTYSAFLNDLDRNNEEKYIDFKYNNDLLIEEIYYTFQDDVKNIYKSFSYLYNNNGTIKEVIYNNNEYKSYIYDKNNNWIKKEVGDIISKNGEKSRVPVKRYTRTINYWN